MDSATQEAQVRGFHHLIVGCSKRYDFYHQSCVKQHETGNLERIEQKND